MVMASADTNNSSSASSNHTSLTFRWSAETVFVTCAAFIAPCANLIPVVAIFAKRLWRNPFYIYLINMLINNIIYHLGFDSFHVVATGYHSWIFGYKLCTYRLYNIHLIGMGHFYGHLLITINRIWATAGPISYRHNHSVKVALAMCATMWALVHVSHLPGVILDALYYRTPVALRGCLLNLEALRAWNTFTVAGRFAVYMINLISCVVIVAKRRKPKVVAENRELSMAKTVASSPGKEAEIQSGPKDVVQKKRNRQAFRVFILMTTSISITWGPLLFALIIGPFFSFNGTLVTVTYWIGQCQGILVDPVLFTVAMKDLRKAVLCKR